MGRQDAKDFEQAAENQDDLADELEAKARKLEKEDDLLGGAEAEAREARAEAKKSRQKADEAREKAADEWDKLGETRKANEVWERSAARQRLRAEHENERARERESEIDDLRRFAERQRERRRAKLDEADKLEKAGKSEEAEEAREIADVMEVEAARAEEELIPQARADARQHRENASDELQKRAEDLEKAGDFDKAAKAWEEAADATPGGVLKKDEEQDLQELDADAAAKRDARYRKAAELWDDLGEPEKAAAVRKKAGIGVLPLPPVKPDPPPPQRRIKLPDNVASADAFRVLAFLNSVESVEDLAAAIEIPGRRDVDLGVAARILEERERIGAFATLEQVDAVPQVGPARFTDIVDALSSLPGVEPVVDPDCPETLSAVAPGTGALAGSSDASKALVEALAVVRGILEFASAATANSRMHPGPSFSS